jgi:hypothetical protein
VAAAVEASVAPREKVVGSGNVLNFYITEAHSARQTGLEVRRQLEQLFLTEAPTPGYKTG